MILCGSSERGAATFDRVLAQAQAGRGRDQAGERTEFLELVRKAQTLAL